MLPVSAQQTFTARFEPDPNAQAPAVFLPAGEENWDKDACWDSGLFPNWPGARVVIPPPTVPDEDGLPRRNVRIATQPVTVGHVTVDNGTFSNRIRNKKDAPAGATLTFDGGAEAASLTVVGDDVGFTAVEVTRGVVLATDLRVVVSNTVGDAEYGGLRVQAGWSGSGGLIKEGPGRCTMTGGGKTYSGSTVIREGVLSMTQPAAPSAAAGVTIESGGQLCLTSGDPLSGTAAHACVRRRGDAGKCRRRARPERAVCVMRRAVSRTGPLCRCHRADGGDACIAVEDVSATARCAIHSCWMAVWGSRR